MAEVGGISMVAIAAALIDSGNPVPEGTSAEAGNTAKAQAAGHVHPRLTSAQYVTTAADGTAACTFTRPFDTQPCPVLCPVNASGVSLDVVSWVQSAGKYVGAVVRAVRRTLQTTSVTVVGIPVIGTVTATEAPVSGLAISVVMLQQS